MAAPLAIAEGSPTTAPVERVVLPGQSPDGRHVLSLLVKRTYTIRPGQRCVRAERDQKLVPGDAHYGDPMNTTVRMESDFVPWKLATDVVLNGTVYAPHGKPATKLIATLAVGPVRKDLYVIGNRKVIYRPDADPTFTDPEPFTKVLLRYENAYGGVDIRSDAKVPCIYSRNHHGRGFAIANRRDVIDQLPLPNLEDPNNRLKPEGLCCGHFMHLERQPMPQNFGWFSKYWQPRAALAGVMPADRAFEQQMRKAYTTLVPAEQRALYALTGLPDMNFAFFNGASPGLVAPYLSGGESVQTAHLTPDATLKFDLPDERPRLALDIGNGIQEPTTVLHTVMIRLDEREVDLVWRGAIEYPGLDWLPNLRKLEVHVV